MIVRKNCSSTLAVKCANFILLPGNRHNIFNRNWCKPSQKLSLRTKYQNHTINHDELKVETDSYKIDKATINFQTESFLTENDPVEQNGILDYRPIESNTRRTAIRGGVVFYTNNNLKYDVSGNETELECLQANVKLVGSNTPDFCVVHRSDNIGFVRFLKLIETLLVFNP